jgi:translation initiation factor IF-1
VWKLLPLGRRKVRLDNGHVVTVLPILGAPTGVPLLGDRVTVEIAFNQLKGWRLARRP